MQISDQCCERKRWWLFGDNERNRKSNECSGKYCILQLMTFELCFFFLVAFCSPRCEWWYSCGDGDE